MTDTKDTLTEIVKTALNHSIAQAFLIFSSGLVIVSIWKSNDYVFISFFTLFYALINFKLEVLRKHESLGRYAVGNDFLQIVLFTVISILYFVWWAMGVAAILLFKFFPTIIFLPHILFFYIFPFHYIFLPSYFALFNISVFVLAISLILTVIWLFNIFDKKRKIEKYCCNEKIYRTKVFCKNCGFKNKMEGIPIPIKRPIKDHPCSNCGLYELELEKKVECLHCLEITIKGE